jgi:hypothetical protein
MGHKAEVFHRQSRKKCIKFKESITGFIALKTGFWGHKPVSEEFKKPVLNNLTTRLLQAGE